MIGIRMIGIILNDRNFEKLVSFFFFLYETIQYASYTITIYSYIYSFVPQGSLEHFVLKIF